MPTSYDTVPASLGLVAWRCCRRRAAADVTVIAGATLIDGRGGAPVKDAVVVVDGGKFVGAGARGSVDVPAGARTIDAKGKFIIPGLMDANVHLVLGSSIEFIVRHEGRYDQLIEEAAQISLKNGLTTVFDSWGPTQPLLDVRERINSGKIPGARIFIAGNIVGFSGPFGRDFNVAAETTATSPLVRRINRLWEENTGPDLLWMTPEQVGVEIRKLHRPRDRLHEVRRQRSSRGKLPAVLARGAEGHRRRVPQGRHHRPDAHDVGREPPPGARRRRRHAAARIGHRPDADSRRHASS